MDVLLDHIVLNVRDIPASLDFYKNILQFEPERVPERQLDRTALFNEDHSLT